MIVEQAEVLANYLQVKLSDCIAGPMSYDRFDAIYTSASVSQVNEACRELGLPLLVFVGCAAVDNVDYRVYARVHCEHLTPVRTEQTPFKPSAAISDLWMHNLLPTSGSAKDGL